MGNPMTVMAWLETLEEPYRSQAIANCKRPNGIASSQSEAVSWAFNWEDSPEKDGYWLDYYEKLKAKEDQTNETEYKVAMVSIHPDVLAELERKAEAYDRIEAVVKGGKQ